ncbi:hypothetical protein SAMN04515667_1798 [Formosa sp. Hel1_31_208]|uniref:hypothetical protein n=1 Tax=Formosa sp. Hel1_31_208 TaxID=1798225 RepID=UPI0008793EB7|nr:hypothetical protein [Formosa sp. Hel1_31_208]SDS27173.1 hypothetical protein SAMN04515667_1798 [Formosa sp. Hel1_31_208]
MRQLLYIFLFGLSFSSCDDGDIFEVTLEFDDTFETCGDLVFYKTKDTPPETLSIQLIGRTIDEFLEVEDNNIYVEAFEFSSTNNAFNYRTYSAAPDPLLVFCNDIPSASIDILSDAESTSGTATITTVLVEDDNDGIPAEFEGRGEQAEDGTYPDAIDTDNDGIPNYLDVDDDGDNVLTTAENPNYTEDFGLIDAQDTDNDGTPDYLDTDDDNDGVATRDEESINADNNPLNDVTEPDIGADYLNDNISITVPATAFIAHPINQVYTISILVENIQLPNLTQDNFDFGTLDDTSITSDTRSGEPIFN